MVCAPRPFKPQIKIAQRAGQSDFTHKRCRMERDRLRLQRGEGAINLALLMLYPFRLAARFIAETALIHLQNGRIHDAVGKRLQSERCNTL